MRRGSFVTAVFLIACATPAAPAPSPLPPASARRVVEGPAFFAIWLPDDEPFELRLTGPRGTAATVTRTLAEIFATGGMMARERGLVVDGQGPGTYALEVEYTAHDRTDDVRLEVSERTELIDVHADFRTGLHASLVESSSSVALTPREGANGVRFLLRNVGERELGPWFPGDIVQLTPTSMGVAVGHSGCGNIVHDHDPPAVAVGAEVEIPLAVHGGYTTLQPGEYLWIVDLGPGARQPVLQEERAEVFTERAGLVRFSLQTAMSRPDP